MWVRASRPSSRASLNRNSRIFLSICHLNTGKQKPYTKDEIDFIAAYIIPRDIWYIMPFEVAGRACSGLILSPHLKNSKHARYKEAWHLLQE